VSDLLQSSLGTPERAYEDDWRLYYAERRAIIRRSVQYALGVAIVAVIIATIPADSQVRHPLTADAIGLIGALCLLATVFQWFRFNYVLGGWTCPRCREPFFRSTLVRNPFSRHCRHCNLLRPKNSKLVQATSI
jgi:hypothetical protein